MAIASGNTVSYDGAKFQLRVEYTYTNTAIKFKPYVVITGKFAHNHECWIRWQLPNKKWAEYRKKDLRTGTHYIPNKNWQTNGDYSVPITATFAGKYVSKVTLTSNLKPPVPTITAKWNNDNDFTLTVKGSGHKAVPVNTVSIRVQEGSANESWTDLRTITVGATGAYTETMRDQTTERGQRYRWAVQATNQAGNSGWSITPWTYTLPPDVADVEHVRNNNNKNTVTWSKVGQQIDRALITSYNVERSESGGAWTKIANVKPGSALDGTVTYVDTKCSPNNTYKYRVKPVNARGVAKLNYPSNSGTEMTYNTPSAPTAVKGAYTTGGTVKLTITNNQKTATGMDIQRQVDGGTWTNVETGITPAGTYTDANAPSGTLKYRVRNSRDDLPTCSQYSAWTTSPAVITLSKPQAPTLIDPVSGSTVTLDAETVRLVWIHNPTDGTEQEAGTVQYRVQGATTWSSATVGAVSYYDLTINGGAFTANDIIEWRVRTKGAFATYSDYSDINTFVLYAVPEITFTAPDNGSVINNLPLALAWSYQDNSGLLSSLTLSIEYEGSTVYTTDIETGTGASGTYSYSLAGFVFENGGTYSLNVTALSSTGLQATDNIGVQIDYVSVTLQDTFFVDPAFDEETGYNTLSLSVEATPFTGVTTEDIDATIEGEYEYTLTYPATGRITVAFVYDNIHYETRFTAGTSHTQTIATGATIAYDGNITLTANNTTDKEYTLVSASYTASASDPEAPEYVDSPIDTAYLYRVYDGNRVLIASSVADGDQVVDRYAPLNVEYQYEILAVATTGEISIITTDVITPTEWWYVYYTAESVDYIARARWQPSGDIKISRPEKKQVRYSGRQYPVTYDSVAREETAGFSTIIEDRETLNSFRTMVETGGQGIWKSADGAVYRADFGFSYSADYTSTTLLWNATLDVTRIDSEEL